MANKEFEVIWNTEDCIDGIPKDTFEEAKDCAMEIMSEWLMDGYAILQKENFSQEVIDGWDEMIEECWVAVGKYNPETKEYEEFWNPSDDDLEMIGWRPFNIFMRFIKEAEGIEEFSDADVSNG